MSMHTCAVDSTHKEETTLVENWPDILSDLDDKIAQLSAMRDSPYFRSVEKKASTIESSFQILGSAAQLLATVQRKWVYLEPIFLRGSIPSLKKRFLNVDSQFRSIMKQLDETPYLPTVCEIDSVES